MQGLPGVRVRLHSRCLLRGRSRGGDRPLAQPPGPPGAPGEGQGDWLCWSGLMSIPSRKMASCPPTGRSYEDAVAALNLLQSNAACLKNNVLGKQETGLACVKRCSEIVGLGPKELSKLSVIHVAGTKGKGSTSAFCESILRHNGYRTGFFSSPHLVSVRERIRIDGKPITRQKFTSYFWHTYQMLQENMETKLKMPPYFAFLTLMAFRVFLEEQIDVAVVEVGIGGEHDSTNILENVSVVGVTALGIDHTSLLGNTLSSIAWQKAGIFKPSAVGYTVPGHTQEALQVLGERAVERRCPVEIVPSLDKYEWPDSQSRQAGLSLFPTQQMNASLALHLTNAWMKRNIKSNMGQSIVTSRLGEASLFPISRETATGLFSCRWPGRMQILQSDSGRIKYFLDGAHTVESMEACVEWFKENCPPRPGVKHALLLNMTGDRDRLQIIEPLLACEFDKVIFSPNLTASSQADNQNLRVTSCTQMQQTVALHDLWTGIRLREHNNNSSVVSSVKGCVDDALQELQDESFEWCILVTGSLHLVGAVLSIIDPQLVKSEQYPSQNK